MARRHARLALRGWTDIYPHVEVHRIETAGHFSQEDEPDRIVMLSEDFLRRIP